MISSNWLNHVISYLIPIIYIASVDYSYSTYLLYLIELTLIDSNQLNRVISYLISYFEWIWFYPHLTLFSFLDTHLIFSLVIIYIIYINIFTHIPIFSSISICMEMQLIRSFYFSIQLTHGLNWMVLITWRAIFRFDCLNRHILWNIFDEFRLNNGPIVTEACRTYFLNRFPIHRK